MKVKYPANENLKRPERTVWGRGKEARPRGHKGLKKPGDLVEKLGGGVFVLVNGFGGAQKKTPIKPPKRRREKE